MALTKAITKEDVKESSGNKNISLRLTISDDATEVATKVFNIDYKQGDDLQAAAQEMQEKMQEFADQVVADRNLYHNATLDAGIVWLNNNVSVEG